MALSFVLSNLACDRCTEGFAHRLDGDAVEDLLEEPCNDHSNRFGSSESTRLSVEDQFFVDSSAGAPVGASNVVGVDLESRDRIGSRRIAEHEVVIALVTIGFLGTFADLDHASPNRARSILKNALVQKIAGAMGRFVMLQGVVNQVLAILGEHDSIDLASGTRLDKLDALVDLRKFCSHRRDGPLQLRVATHRSSLVCKVPATFPPILKVDIPQVAIAMLDQFHPAAVQAFCSDVGTR